MYLIRLNTVVEKLALANCFQYQKFEDFAELMLKIQVFEARVDSSGQDKNKKYDQGQYSHYLMRLVRIFRVAVMR